MAAYLGAFLFGVTVAIAIGPIALLILRAGVERGFAAGARSGLGAATADLIYAIVAFSAGATLVTLLEAHRPTIEATGGCLLIALGMWIAVCALREPSDASARAAPLRYGFGATFALTLVNPLTIVIFASFASQVGLAGRAWEIGALAFAVFLGSLVVQLALAAFGAVLHRNIRDHRALAALNLLSGLGIAAFGIHGLLRS